MAVLLPWTPSCRSPSHPTCRVVTSRPRTRVQIPLPSLSLSRWPWWVSDSAVELLSVGASNGGVAGGGSSGMVRGQGGLP